MSDGQTTSRLAELADYIGIVGEYHSQTGEPHSTTDDTRRALLAALGIDASTEEHARAELSQLRTADRLRLIVPVRVLEVGSNAIRTVEVHNPLPRGTRAVWRLELERENGHLSLQEGEWQGEPQLTLEGVGDLPPGYHRLRVAIDVGPYEIAAEQSLIIVPPRCVTPRDLVGERGSFGLTTNLYTLRSRGNWGIGDFSDLGSLAEWGGSIGADFVGVNPLHALLNRGSDVSPYSPVSRLYRNPIYIDVSRVPELEDAPEVRERITSSEFHTELEALRASPQVRYEQVMGVKGLALDALHRVFRERVRGSGNARDREYEQFLERRGRGITDFAIWMAIAERQGRGPDWRTWPVELRRPRSPAVRRFAEAHEARVDFHRWLQFEADRQLAAAAVAARDAGMRIGLYQDLAIGTSPASADTWSYDSLFVRGASVGAPPDPYAAEGQNWGLPPLNPRTLQQSGYRYFIDLVRSGFEHAGALRIDHVMGLFRLFWIPEAKSGKEGAYVRYPHDDLLGIIALESMRHNAVVVGEDLGTVPPDVPPALEKWGVLSSKVLIFERDSGGAFKPSTSYPSLALATANTHDLPTLSGFWEGRDIDVRLEVGLIGEEEGARARQERDGERQALLDRLQKEQVLPESNTPRSPTELRAAAHAFLCRTPSELVGLSLDDLVGELDPVNVPGVGADKHASWTRKMRCTLEEIAASDDVRAALRCDGRVRSGTSIGEHS